MCFHMNCSNQSKPNVCVFVCITMHKSSRKSWPIAKITQDQSWRSKCRQISRELVGHFYWCLTNENVFAIIQISQMKCDKNMSDFQWPLWLLTAPADGLTLLPGSVRPSAGAVSSHSGHLQAQRCQTSTPYISETSTQSVKSQFFRLSPQTAPTEVTFAERCPFYLIVNISLWRLHV